MAKKVTTILTVWTAFHASVWIFGAGDSLQRSWAGMSFWPFQGTSIIYYDGTELFVYGILPWLAYLVHRSLTAWRRGNGKGPNR